MDSWQSVTKKRKWDATKTSLANSFALARLYRCVTLLCLRLFVLFGLFVRGTRLTALTAALSAKFTRALNVVLLSTRTHSLYKFIKVFMTEFLAWERRDWMDYYKSAAISWTYDIWPYYSVPPRGWGKRLPPPGFRALAAGKNFDIKTVTFSIS